MSLIQLLAGMVFLLLLGAALNKVLDPGRASASTARMLALPTHAAFAAMLAAAAIEGFSAMLLLLPGWTAIGLLGTAFVWLAYALASGLAALRGDRHFDCGCSFGTRGRDSDSRVVAARAGLMALCALILASGNAAPIWADGLALAAAAALLTLGFAATQILHNHHRHGSLAE